MRIQVYGICLISFFSLYELFLAFICANNTGSLVNKCFGVQISNPFPSAFSSFTGGIGDTSLSSPSGGIGSTFLSSSKGGMDNKSVNSSSYLNQPS